MLPIVFLIMAAVGFMVGSTLVIVLNGGLEDPGSALGVGLLGALAFVLLQFYLTLSTRLENKAGRLKLRHRRPVSRTESEGTFSDRMERFAANVEQAPEAQVEQPKMPLWMAEDWEEFKPTPPKSIFIIRILLHRIREILTGI